MSSAIVVGGGIAGLTTAAALAERGWEVRLYERQAQLRAHGSGIYLWDNGLAVLNDLAVVDDVIEGAHYGPAIETRNERNESVAVVMTGPAAPVHVLTVMRSRLIEELAAACTARGVEVHTGREGIAATPSGDVSFADGTTDRADLVVVADGVNSRIRDGLGLIRSRRRLDQMCARVLVPRQAGLLPDEDDPKYIEWMAGRRFVLWTPSSAEWLYIALVCPEDDPAVVPTLGSSEWARTFPHLEALFTMLDGVDLQWAPFEHVVLERWSTGRVAVLGDAGHAQPPYLGQGGGCAMTNAVGLAYAVSENEGPLPGRLDVWEATERPLIEHTQDFSVAVAMMNDVPDGPRSTFIRALSQSPDYGGARLRAATTTPTGIAPYKLTPTPGVS